jgi:hypothetical protein
MSPLERWMLQEWKAAIRRLLTIALKAKAERK